MNHQNVSSNSLLPPNIYIEECQLHRLEKQKNTCLFSGCLKVRQVQNSEAPQKKVYLLELGTFKLELGKSDLILHAKQYSNSVSYIFEHQDQIKVLSLLKDQQKQERLAQFGNFLQKLGIYKSFVSERMDDAFKKKVLDMRPNIEVEQIWDKGILANTTNYLVKGLGSVVGFIQTKTYGTAQYIDQRYRESVDRLSKTDFAQGNKTKWQYVKDKAWQLDQTMTQWIKPIGNKTSEWTSKIGETLTRSDNKAVKYIKNISKAAQRNLNEGYKNVVKTKATPAQNVDIMAEYQRKVDNSEIQMKEDEIRQKELNFE